MNKDKYSALWVSYSSISDYLKCPRLYFLNNVYRNPKTGHKINLISAPLALGQAVHETLESLSILPAEERFNDSLMEKFHSSWEKISGKHGGFISKTQEKKYKLRGEKMISRVLKHPGPIKNKAIKIKADLPYFWLSEEEDIILCGKIDWMEYLPESNGVHLIDFKTGMKPENNTSLQMPIYFLLATNCQKRQVKKLSYWYLERRNTLDEVELPNLDIENDILTIARKIKLAKQMGRLECRDSGCGYCQPLEKIVNGEGELVGVNNYGQDVFFLDEKDKEMESEIL